MQPLHGLTDGAPTTQECAALLLEVVPPVMRAIRTEMRRNRAADLSVPQLRTLIYLSRHSGASLSDLAEHVGLTLPSASRLVDALVARCAVARMASAADRRRVALMVTEPGAAILAEARRATQTSLAARLAGLSEEERRAVARAMRSLRTAFARPDPALAAGK